MREAGITAVNYGKELARIVSDSSEMDEMAGSRERGESASVGGRMIAVRLYLSANLPI